MKRAQLVLLLLFLPLASAIASDLYPGDPPNDPEIEEALTAAKKSGIMAAPIKYCIQYRDPEQRAKNRRLTDRAGNISCGAVLRWYHHKRR
jgi:hypothetical protein